MIDTVSFLSAGLGVLAANTLIFTLCTLAVVREFRLYRKAVDANSKRIDDHTKVYRQSLDKVMEQIRAGRKEVDGIPRELRVFRGMKKSDDDGQKGGASDRF